MKKILLIIGVIFIILILNYSFNQKNKSNNNQEKVNIGVMVPLTGDYASFGDSIKNGIILANKDIGNENKISFNPIYEDACFPKDTPIALERLLNNHISAIIGSFCLVGMPPLFDSIEKNKLITFNTTVNPDFITNKPYIFSTNISVKDDAEKMASFASQKLLAKKAVIIYLDNPFGEDYKKYISAKFTSEGGTIVSTEGKSPDTHDFRTTLTKIKSEHPDVVFIVHLGGSVGNFLKEIKELDIKAAVIGHNEAEDPLVLSVAGVSAEGFYVSSLDPQPASNSENDFNDKYMSQFGTKPDIFARNAYDAMKLYAYAYNDCGNNSECIKDKIISTKDYPGASGDISMSENGIASKPTSIKVVKNGEFVLVQ